MKAKVPQREVHVEVEGQSYAGRYEIQDFAHGGHTVVVWFRGRTAIEQIPPEVKYESYTDFLAEKMLEGLVKEDESA